MYIEVRSNGQRVEYENARGPLINPHPFIDESKWGDEAKSGLKYKIALNDLCCPGCRRRVDSSELVHKETTKRWLTFCRHCRPELSTAL